MRFEAVHIPGLKNVLADKLSRFQITEFRNLAPHKDKAQTDIAHLVNNVICSRVTGKTGTNGK
jgi:hypothetical protein